jgi:hypothetical protein
VHNPPGLEVHDHLLDDIADFVDLSIVVFLPVGKVATEGLLAWCDHAIADISFIFYPVVGGCGSIATRFCAWIATVRCSHWNIHAERGAITSLSARNNPDHSGELSKLHLPVGGARMRPCLEDLLQLLVQEFRFDSMPDVLKAIEGVRVKWRRQSRWNSLNVIWPPVSLTAQLVRQVDQGKRQRIDLTDGAPVGPVTEPEHQDPTVPGGRPSRT